MPEEIDSDAYRITWLIRRLYRALGNSAGGYLNGLGITAADRAVMEFIHPDRQLAVPEIARRYRVSRQHVQVTVNSLIDKGLAAAVDNPGHKRSPLIELTEAGRDLFQTVLEREREAIDRLFANVPPEDRRRTRETLETLYNNVS